MRTRDGRTLDPGTRRRNKTIVLYYFVVHVNALNISMDSGSRTKTVGVVFDGIKF